MKDETGAGPFAYLLLVDCCKICINSKEKIGNNMGRPGKEPELICKADLHAPTNFRQTPCKQSANRKRGGL